MVKQEKKSTDELLAELKTCEDFTRYYRENQNERAETDLSRALEELLAKKGLQKKDVVRSSNLSEVYAYQIFDGKRRPKREKLLCLAVAMKLSLDEVQKLLKTTGYAPLYPRNGSDCAIIYGICQGMDVVRINDLLYEYGEETLG
ncbi:MAG: helix-turn-helix transcriptional regulator [Clostridia bacterium]|nr:helix-turn-helix transcriptional regulator [Clostridia bacterium]